MSGVLSVVVPCAGAGSRLGLPFPKELLPTPDGRVLLDQVFDLVAGLDARLVLVTGPDRGPTISHIHRTYPQLPVASVRQPGHAVGLFGAIRATVPFIGDRAVVLLPDQRLCQVPDPSPVRDAAQVLADGAAMCFLAAPCNDPQRIAVDGALRVDDPADTGGRLGLVRGLGDKPGLSAANAFNAVWFGFGFRREAANQVLDQLDAAQRHQLDADAFAAGPLSGAPVVPVAPFVDCGTWPSVTALWRGGME
ncbi:NTP transferase domain-containing protein [Micromonospora endophytica]|uniref:MobA-like NTP transferase domain-containing protein n=1 Tax=Micromonospora endophytica TaxID=515350 RepID=A0A2W2CIW5_9ACTN|nr:NTP transferase domain-containing protein [Micromonospora endophytica]PZF99391.1 hypothetical protein C1I93_05900 [Micromonospora endophytica]RIW42900.1 hypothetical protein D3H59_21995 [Micromonospora endophytica]BCJ61581.1 hypothetical protein Jiend_50030 [Micromonospora endophytica]